MNLCRLFVRRPPVGSGLCLITKLAAAVATSSTVEPALEARLLLQRVQSLVVHDLRWDDEARVELAVVVGRLYDATIAYDPQHLEPPAELATTHPGSSTTAQG